MEATETSALSTVFPKSRSIMPPDYLHAATYHPILLIMICSHLLFSLATIQKCYTKLLQGCLKFQQPTSNSTKISRLIQPTPYIYTLDNENK